MRVLSLYDGMSCGMLAFMRAGIPVESYDAYEIDKPAIQVALDNYPDIIEMGDAFQVRDDAFWDKLHSMGLSRCE